MGDIRHFKTAEERDIEEFFATVAESFEWADEIIFISHKNGGDLQTGILAKDPEKSQDLTYMLGILTKTILSAALDSMEE